MQEPLVQNRLQRDSILDAERCQKLDSPINVHIDHPRENYHQILDRGRHSRLEDFQSDRFEEVVIPVDELFRLIWQKGYFSEKEKDDVRAVEGGLLRDFRLKQPVDRFDDGLEMVLRYFLLFVVEF